MKSIISEYFLALIDLCFIVQTKSTTPCCTVLGCAQTRTNWRLKRFHDFAFCFDFTYINKKLTKATHFSAVRLLTFHRALDTVPRNM